MRPLVALAVLGTIGCGSVPPDPPAVDPAAPRFALLTYNVNYGLAGDPATLEAIRGSSADLVLLQESSPAWASALESLRPQYPHQAFVHRPAAGGLGILSRRPFAPAAVLEPPDGGWFPAWIVVAETPIGPIQILSVHLRPALGERGGIVSGHFGTPAVREAEIGRYLERLDPALPTVLAGDFNEPAGGAAHDLARSRGFMSALDLIAPDADTWRWRTSLGTLERRLDDVLHDPRLEPAEAAVLEAGRSDHLPIRVVLVASRP